MMISYVGLQDALIRMTDTAYNIAKSNVSHQLVGEPYVVDLNGGSGEEVTAPVSAYSSGGGGSANSDVSNNVVSFFLAKKAFYASAKGLSVELEAAKSSVDVFS